MSSPQIEQKPAHNGTCTPLYGRTVWLLRRCDGVVYGAWKTRHDALGAAVSDIDNNRWDWFDPIAVPVGQIPMEDIRYV